MRIILYTGKGGVGKTSVAAASALRCADLGYRTIVVSTDAAHSLADSFDLPLGAEPTPITENLWGQEIDVLYQMEKYWGTINNWLVGVLAWRGIDELIAEEASVLPGMDELASLLQIVLLHDSGLYDVIVVDCAPTGETLKFLSLPEAARWYLERIFPIERQAAKIAGPIIRAMTDIPIPDEAVFDSIKNLILQLNRMHDLLTDSSKSTMRLVLNPEKMVIKEAQRTFTYLNLYGFATDLIVSNRVLPSGIQSEYFAVWKDIQQKYGHMIEEAFAPLPIYQVPLFDQEVVGLDMLRRMAEAIYAQTDPSQILYQGRTQHIEKDNGNYRLLLPLPFVRKEDIHLNRNGDELIISIGNFRRNLVLPRALSGLDIQRAKFEGDTLAVTFGQS